MLAPGLVDLHTHLREPGFEHKETIVTGTRAAAVGGFTAVSSMANTDPVTDHAGIVAEIRDKAADAGLADVFPVGAITKGLAGESMAELGEMVEAGVRVFSDDGQCRADRPDAAERARLRQGRSRTRSWSPTTARMPRSSRAATCTKGELVDSLGLAGQPQAEEIVGGPCHLRGQRVAASTSATSRASARSS